MKYLTLIILISLSNILISQNIEIEVSQNNKKVKMRNRMCTLSKAPFSLVFKFTTTQYFNLIAGSNNEMSNSFNAKHQEKIIQLASKAGFGGADGYFNEDRSIKAWDEKVCTSIFLEDETHHTFDSIYKKGKYTYGVRTIEKLSTPNDYYFIEGWKDNNLIIAVATTREENLSGTSLKINFKEITRPVTDVRGKEYVEVGESVFQEGCEGCGNLASFHFLMNGKNVDYLLSGSDTGSYGEYAQSGNQIKIGKEFSFTISDDGQTIIDNNSGVKHHQKSK